MTAVIDASVAAKWFVAETGSGAAKAIFGRTEALIAPDLILIEVGSVLAKKVWRDEIEESLARRAIGDLPSLLDSVIASEELLDEALMIAFETRHSLYDCLYLALAQARNASLATFDRRFGERLAGTSYAAMIETLR